MSLIKPLISAVLNWAQPKADSRETTRNEINTLNILGRFTLTPRAFYLIMGTIAFCPSCFHSGFCGIRPRLGKGHSSSGKNTLPRQNVAITFGSAFSSKNRKTLRGAL
jgi:hypothetical protein